MNHVCELKKCFQAIKGVYLIFDGLHSMQIRVVASCRLCVVWHGSYDWITNVNLHRIVFTIVHLKATQEAQFIPLIFHRACLSYCLVIGKKGVSIP